MKGLIFSVQEMTTRKSKRIVPVLLAAPISKLHPYLRSVQSARPPVYLACGVHHGLFGHHFSFRLIVSCSQQILPYLYVCIQPAAEEEMGKKWPEEKVRKGGTNQ